VLTGAENERTRVVEIVGPCPRRGWRLVEDLERAASPAALSTFSMRKPVVRGGSPSAAVLRLLSTTS
jgi:hypothetical protein